MYEADGIDLSKSEFDELVALANCGGDVVRFAQERIDSDHSLAAVYWSLDDHGLVSGTKVRGSYVFRGLPRKGPDWLASYEKSKRDRKWLTRREWGMIAVNLGGGAALGALASIVLRFCFGI